VEANDTSTVPCASPKMAPPARVITAAPAATAGHQHIRPPRIDQAASRREPGPPVLQRVPGPNAGPPGVEETLQIPAQRTGHQRRRPAATAGDGFHAAKRTAAGWSRCRRCSRSRWDGHLESDSRRDRAATDSPQVAAARRAGASCWLKSQVVEPSPCQSTLISLAHDQPDRDSAGGGMGTRSRAR